MLNDNGPHSRTVLRNKFVLKSYLRRFYEDCGIHDFFSYPGFFLGKNKSYEHSGVLLIFFSFFSIISYLCIYFLLLFIFFIFLLLFFGNKTLMPSIVSMVDNFIKYIYIFNLFT